MGARFLRKKDLQIWKGRSWNKSGVIVKTHNFSDVCRFACMCTYAYSKIHNLCTLHGPRSTDTPKAGRAPRAETLSSK